MTEDEKFHIEHEEQRLYMPSLLEGSIQRIIDELSKHLDKVRPTVELNNSYDGAYPELVYYVKRSGVEINRRMKEFRRKESEQAERNKKKHLAIEAKELKELARLKRKYEKGT